MTGSIPTLQWAWDTAATTTDGMPQTAHRVAQERYAELMDELLRRHRLVSRGC